LLPGDAARRSSVARRVSHRTRSAPERRETPRAMFAYQSGDLPGWPSEPHFCISSDFAGTTGISRGGAGPHFIRSSSSKPAFLRVGSGLPWPGNVPQDGRSYPYERIGGGKVRHQAPGRHMTDQGSAWEAACQWSVKVAPYGCTGAPRNPSRRGRESAGSRADMESVPTNDRGRMTRAKWRQSRWSRLRCRSGREIPTR
jgi:hypothetical protein